MTPEKRLPGRTGVVRARLFGRLSGVGALVMACAVFLGACASSPIPPPPSGAGAYQSGNYQEAYRLSASEYSRTEGVRRDRAALTAGLSAHAMGHSALAESWLRPLERHPDPAISGRAAATLGLIAQERGDHEQAAALLSRAARQLEGDASARANFQAAESYAALGRVDSARLHYRLARGGTPAQDQVRTLSNERLELSGYTLQAGAFANQANARELANRLSTRAQALGYGEPRIVQRTPADGRVLYLVHIGSFATERDAQTARIRMGGDAVVAPAARR